MRIFFFMVLCWLGFYGFSQSITQLKTVADSYYESKKYLEAKDFYERLHDLMPKDRSIHFRYASCLFNALRYSEAKKEYEALYLDGGFADSVVYNYGLSIKILGDYQKADSVFGALLYELAPENRHYKLAEFQKAGCQLGLRQLTIKNNRNFRLFERLNSKEHDFGAIQNPVTGEIVISTSRKTGGKQFFDGQYGGLLPNMICFDQNADEDCDLYDELNSQWAEGTGTFSGDGKHFYFSSCQKDRGCRLFESQFTEGGWSTPKPLDDKINYPGSNCRHPALSLTGDTLFFSSNRPGGKGGVDIWMSIKVNKSDWSPAINLGETINTTADEITPFYSSRYEALLFASNGHAGYGGYDIFIAKGNSFFAPGIYNIGQPFNSALDDTYFALGTTGMISSDRAAGDFNIYQFDYNDEVQLLMSFVNVESLVDLTKYNMTSLSLETFRIEDYESYHIFIPVKDQVEELHGQKHKNIFGVGEPEQEVILKLDEENSIATLVNAQNKFEFRLLPDSLDHFEVEINNEKVQSIVKDTTYDYHRYEYETIYFDFNATALRDESIESLKDLVHQFGKENIVLVDIHTHADAMGSHDYNFSLSEKRGFSVMRYMLELGLPYRQARVFANGEENPITSIDTWYGQLFNRRAELVVYTKHPVTYMKAKVYLVRHKISLGFAAEQLGLPADKLKEWNGLTSTVLDEGHVLRVLDPQHQAPGLRYLIPQEYYSDNIFNHVVQAGETLRKIADKYRIPEELIYEINKLNGEVKRGDVLVIYL
mgnify:CR=1 FL=1|tara:strand:- start:71429 stop:73726 length:2298 start_codon:yes stop_codon:yes gene_type:complete